MPVALVIAFAVVLTTGVEVFKYFSEKKADPHTSKTKIIANGAEQLLIVFLSALVAMYLANDFENRKKDEQIVRILDVAEEELVRQLECYSRAADKEARSRETDQRRYFEDTFYDGMDRTFRNISLTEVLYSDSVVVRIDPDIAYNIAYLERKYNKAIEDFQHYYETKEDADSAKEYAYLAGYYNGHLISLVESQKAALTGKPVYSRGDKNAKFLPDKAQSLFEKFLSGMQSMPAGFFSE